MLDTATALLTPLVGILGVMGGAWMNHRLSEKRAESQRIVERRLECYSDYVRAVAAMKFHRHGGDPLLALERLTDAKVQLAVYGEPAVIAALAQFERNGALLDDDGMALFLKAIEGMRPSADVAEGADGDDLAALIAGVQGEYYS